MIRTTHASCILLLSDGYYTSNWVTHYRHDIIRSDAPCPMSSTAEDGQLCSGWHTVRLKCVLDKEGKRSGVPFHSGISSYLSRRQEDHEFKPNLGN